MGAGVTCLFTRTHISTPTPTRTRELWAHVCLGPGSDLRKIEILGPDPRKVKNLGPGPTRARSSADPSPVGSRTGPVRT